VKIEWIRKDKKMTQKELAEKAGISVRTLQYWESGQRSPTIKMLYKVADALDVNVSELI